LAFVCGEKFMECVQRGMSYDSDYKKAEIAEMIASIEIVEKKKSRTKKPPVT
jgi:hypothetical protein